MKQEPILLEHKPIFEEAFSTDPHELSEYTFSGLYAWRGSYDLRWSRHEGFLILSALINKTKYFFDPIGLGDKKNAIKNLINETGIPFFKLPRGTADLFRGDKEFTLQEDRDYADYLYSADNLAKLSGRKYDGKRNLIKRFRSKHVYKYETISTHNIKECIELAERWHRLKDFQTDKGIGHERQATVEYVNHFTDFNLIGAGIRIDGVLVSMVIAEQNNMDTMVIHILKADTKITGLYQTTLNEFSASLPKEIKFVNLEQDLGIPGLRKSKKSYYPLRMIESYTLQRANGR